MAEHDVADADALEADHLEPDQLAHAADLALLALGEHEAQLLGVLPVDARPLERLAVEGQAVPQARQLLAREDRLHVGRAFGAAHRVAHAHEVLLLHAGVLADELARDAAVLREHQQADRIDVEPARGRQATQLLRREAHARAVAAPVVALLHERDGGLVPVLRLAADVAHRLVQQDGDLLRLLAAGARVDLDAVLRADLQAHGRDGAVDLDPALLDPRVGLAARTQAEVGHAFVEADRLGGVGHGLQCY